MKNLDFVCFNSKLYEREYYSALPLYLGFSLHPENELWLEMNQWCKRNLDKRNSWPDLHSPTREAWYSNNYTFWFRNLNDRNLFLEHFNKDN